MKKLLANLSMAALIAVSAISSAQAASGSFARDQYTGESYTILRLDNGRVLRLYPTRESCGNWGASYNRMGSIINGGWFNASVDANCGAYKRICVSNDWDSACSTYIVR